MGEARFATVNGVRTAYETSGSGFPLLLLHGFPRTRRTWEQITPALAERFTVVAPDRRGYGDSERIPDPAAYGLAAMAEDAVALMDHLGHERFVVVGHDKGAPTARRVAADLPERVVGMVQIDSTPQGVGEGRRDPSGRQWYFDFFRQRNVAEPIVNAVPELFFGLFLDRNPHLSPEERAFYVEAFSLPGTADAVIWDYRLALEEDPAYWRAEVAAGRKIAVPMLSIWGASGPSVNADVLGAWREVADDVRGWPVDGSAHYVHEQQPEATVAAILGFADELGLP
ncbi:MAG: alpha/beta hydrolase [Chloroflexota bacterium]|nr:alpha/beta hydrolase [Chloroflexota bacterium]MDE2885371.1 alpha/beta hydrolase [Chloroflexota bacterium]